MPESFDNIRENAPNDPMLAMGSCKPYPQRLPDIEAFVVEFDGVSDPWKPLNWPSWTKYVSAHVGAEIY